MASDVIGSGLGFPLVVGPHGGLGTTTGTARIEQSMRLILLTYPGERAMRPTFGCTLRDHVFGLLNHDELVDVAREVRRALDVCEPRVAVDEVHARPSPVTDTILLIDITYRVLATGEVRTLEVPFERLPSGEEA